MGSRAVLAGTAVAGLLISAMVVVGVLRDLPLLVATGACAYTLFGLLLIADTWRRVRELRTFVKDEVRRAALGGERRISPPAATQDDLLGSLRIIEAEHAGRLDRMQASLDQTLEDLRGTARRPDPGAR